MEGNWQAVTRMTLDMSLPDVQKSFSCTKGDVNRRLEITLTNGGNPFAIPKKWTAFLSGTKPDETEIYNGCVVDRGRIIYDFLSGKEIATCVGAFEIQFDIFDENGYPTASPKVWVQVLDARRMVASKDEFTAWSDLIGSINAVQEDVDALAADVDGKIAKPDNEPQVGKVLKVSSVHPDGTFECQWVDDMSEGTTVTIGGEKVSNINFNSDPQTQIDGINDIANDAIEDIGDKSQLTTDNKSNLVSAINEVFGKTADIYTNPSAPIMTVGGIGPSTFPKGFENNSLSDIMNAMFYPYTKPVINRLMFTPWAGVKKKGNAINVTQVSVSFLKNSKNIVRIEVYNGDTLKLSKDQTFTASSSLDFTYRDVMDGNTNTTFTVRVIDEAGGYGEASVEYIFVDPYYFAVLSDGDEISENHITAGEERIEMKGTKVHSFTTAYNQFPVIAYPAAYGDLSSIQDANGFSQVWNRTTVTISGVEYYVYYGGSAAAENFKYTFNY